MTIEISSDNQIILENYDIRDSEVKRAFTRAGQWISNIEKRLNEEIEKREAEREKNKTKIEIISIILIALTTIGTYLLVFKF